MIGILASVLFKIINKKKPSVVDLWDEIETNCEGANCTAVKSNQNHSQECNAEHGAATAVYPELKSTFISGPRLTEDQIARDINETFRKDFHEYGLPVAKVTHTQSTKLKEANNLIGELVELLEGEIPTKNCTCFKNPPCGNCVDYSMAYEVIKGAKEFLKSNS